VQLLLDSRACPQPGLGAQAPPGTTARCPSPLVAAAVAGGPAAAKLLLAAGAAADAVDGLGRRPLPCAAAAGCGELCELLLEARADVNARGSGGSAGGDARGVAALSIAVSAGNGRLVDTLIS
ncbi:unnamed protein product, partial [Polarella glacialis]